MNASEAMHMKSTKHQIDDIDDVIDSIFEKEENTKRQEIKVTVRQELVIPATKFVPPKKKIGRAHV